MASRAPILAVAPKALAAIGSPTLEWGENDDRSPPATPIPSVIVNAVSLLALIALAIGVVVAYRAGVARGLRERPHSTHEDAQLRRQIVEREAMATQLGEFAEDRRRLLREVADARGETARYRELLVDLENNAPPPLLDTPGAPDDLKLIVGVGPVLERMLHQLGVHTYRQIARWSEREIDEFNARLPEFPGRIRRDAWVTQARALHQAKYGETLPSRERA